MAPADEELDKLIARVALADRQAFSRLYDLTSAKLFGVCLRILKDRMQAEDALQDAYVKIWRNAGSFAPDRARAMTWLIAIARHRSIDMLRARPAAGAGLDDAETVADPLPDPERHAMNAGEGRRIDACLEELKPERSDAVRAAYVEGYSYAELAERFSVPLNTMRTWLRRSLISLRECLEREQ